MSTLPLPGGINPFIRFGTSYREPEITVRYLVRNFGTPVFSIPSLPNTEIEPEKGKNLDVGVKLDRRSIRASVGYFKNDLKNFAQDVFASVCIPADPANGMLPDAVPALRLHAHALALLLPARLASSAEVHFKGFEGMLEASIPLGDVGQPDAVGRAHLDLKSTDDAPSPDDIAIVEQFYNRSDTPIELEGGVEDIPPRGVVPFQGSFALRFSNKSNTFWAEYEWRFANQIKMPPPADVLGQANTTQYGLLKSLAGFDKHSIRAGYSFGTRVPVKLTVGRREPARRHLLHALQPGARSRSLVRLRAHLRLEEHARELIRSSSWTAARRCRDRRARGSSHGPSFLSGLPREWGWARLRGAKADGSERAVESPRSRGSAGRRSSPGPRGRGLRIACTAPRRPGLLASLALGLCLTASSFGAQAGAGSDWPRFRGPNGDGIVPHPPNLRNHEELLCLELPVADRGALERDPWCPRLRSSTTRLCTSAFSIQGWRVK